MKLSGTVAALAAMAVFAAGLQAQVLTTSITGTVSDAITHQPIPHAQLLTASGPDVLTAEDGSFTVRDIPPGDAHFLVRAGGYRQVEDSLHIMPGGVQRQDWELHPMGRLTVRLADADTGDALGLSVALRPRTLYATGGATIPTGKKGETAFINLETGDYIIEVDGYSDGAPDIANPANAKPDSRDRTSRAKAYGMVWYPGVPELSMAQTVHLEEGGATDS